MGRSNEFVWNWLEVGDPLRTCAWSLAEDVDPPGARLEKPGQRLQERGLPRPVRADEGERTSQRQLEIEVGNDRSVAVADRGLTKG